MLEVEIVTGPTPDYNYPNIHEDEPIITANSIFNPSGLEGLNTTFPTYVNPNEETTAAGIVPQPFTPQEHNPTIQSSQATDDISWAGGEGWSEEEFGGPGWTYGGGNSDTDGSLSYTFNGGGGGSAGSAPVSQNVLVPQDLRQRTPSGTMYAPDLSAYNDSSLFNYTGPGGVSEYTYGQGLPYQGADYSIWGTPANVPNPYYEGQFGEGYTEPVGVADGAISLPPVDMPAGVAATNNNPNVGTSNTNINTGGGVGAGGGRVNQGSEYETGPVYATAEDAMAAGDYWSAYRKDHARWRAENPNAGTYDYPGNPALGIRSDANQLQAMGMGDRGNLLTNKTEPLSYEEYLNNLNIEKFKQASEKGTLGNTGPQTIYGTDFSPNRWDKYSDTTTPTTTTTNSGLEWSKDTNNPTYTAVGGKTFYNPYDGGEFDARQNYLAGPYDADNYSIWNNEYDLGRPGDPSYEEFVSTFQPITDLTPLLQAKADQMMANLTKEELRDGLFIEPKFKRVDGEIVGKMGIPDIFTQDKGFGRIDLFADDGWSEFDPENPYAEPSKDLVLGSDNNYYNEYDDLMLEPVIPATQDASEYAAEQEALRVAQAQADAKEAQEAQEKYIREQKEARDAVLAAQAKAKAEAEAKAKAAAAAASAAAAAQAAQAAQEYETGPVDTPNIFTSAPEPSSFSNYNDDYSNYTNSYFSGGFW